MTCVAASAGTVIIRDPREELASQSFALDGIFGAIEMRVRMRGQRGRVRMRGRGGVFAAWRGQAAGWRETRCIYIRQFYCFV